MPRRPLRGSKEIAFELGVSPRTLHRMQRKGVLALNKVGCGGKTSPLVASREDLDQIKKKE